MIKNEGTVFGRKFECGSFCFSFVGTDFGELLNRTFYLSNLHPSAVPGVLL